jgi:DNA-binding MarR family transcriptional regulator
MNRDGDTLTLADGMLDYQAEKLQVLVSEIIKCCDDRKLYENKKFGIPYAEIKCLLQFRGERYLTGKVLAQRMDVAKSRVTRLVDGLVKKGLVVRFDDPQDTRIKLLCLTQSGRRSLEEVEAFHLALHKKLLATIGSDDRSSILSSLEKLRSCMEAVKAELK